MTFWGLLAAPSVMINEPKMRPVVEGLKVTEIVQLPPTAMLLAQLFVWLKSPVAVIPETLKIELDVLVTVRVAGVLEVPTSWPGNESSLADKLTVESVPVPVRTTVWVLPATPSSLSVRVSVPVYDPKEGGENVI
jgi:hypothetical protein